MFLLSPFIPSSTRTCVIMIYAFLLLETFDRFKFSLWSSCFKKIVWQTHTVTQHACNKFCAGKLLAFGPCTNIWARRTQYPWSGAVWGNPMSRHVAPHLGMLADIWPPVLMSFWIFPTKFPECSPHRNVPILVGVKIYQFFSSLAFVGQFVHVAQSGRGPATFQSTFGHIGPK